MATVAQCDRVASVFCWQRKFFG